MEHEAEYEWLVEELDPYEAMLRFGHVTRDVDNPDEWRAEIRRQARADKRKVRTFVVGMHGDATCVWAGFVREVSDEQLASSFALMDLQQEARDRSSLFGHEVAWLRAHRRRAAGRCKRCGARVYVENAGDRRVLEGEVFEEVCV
jgi:hypothetical protein